MIEVLKHSSYVGLNKATCGIVTVSVFENIMPPAKYCATRGGSHAVFRLHLLFSSRSSILPGTGNAPEQPEAAERHHLLVLWGYQSRDRMEVTDHRAPQHRSHHFI